MVMSTSHAECLSKAATYTAPLSAHCESIVLSPSGQTYGQPVADLCTAARLTHGPLLISRKAAD